LGESLPEPAPRTGSRSRSRLQTGTREGVNIQEAQAGTVSGLVVEAGHRRPAPTEQLADAGRNLVAASAPAAPDRRPGANGDASGTYGVA
jgi:hypothetical protein